MPSQESSQPPPDWMIQQLRAVPLPTFVGRAPFSFATRRGLAAGTANARRRLQPQRRGTSPCHAGMLGDPGRAGGDPRRVAAPGRGRGGLEGDRAELATHPARKRAVLVTGTGLERCQPFAMFLAVFRNSSYATNVQCLLATALLSVFLLGGC